jgi:hypothetical protein
MKIRSRSNPVSHLRAARARLVLAALATASAASAGTVAYYRFDDAANAAPSGALTAPIPDASGNGHDLEPIQSPTLSSEVPLATVPATGAANKSSVRIMGELSQDLYSPADERLSRVGFTAFTIEAWVRFASIRGVQTIIGRDDINEGEGPQALFYLSKSHDGSVPDGVTPNGLRVELVTKDNRLLAINSAHVVQPGVWRHVAVVGDPASGMLSLYADGVRVGQAEGFTGLFSPSRHGMWSVGRGQYKGRVADRFDGFVDEVRFSDEALAPERFLNAAPPPPPAPPVVEPAPVAEPAPAAEPASEKPSPARRKFWPWWPRRR